MTYFLDRTEGTDRVLLATRTPRRRRCGGGATRTHILFPVPPQDEDPRDFEEAEAVIRQHRGQRSSWSLMGSEEQVLGGAANTADDPVAFEHGLGASSYPADVPPNHRQPLRVGPGVVA